MNANARKAQGLLRHYLRTIAQESGMRWESDNEVEISQIVEYLMDAVTEEIDEAIKSHNDARLSHKRV